MTRPLYVRKRGKRPYPMADPKAPKDYDLWCEEGGEWRERDDDSKRKEVQGGERFKAKKTEEGPRLF